MKRAKIAGSALPAPVSVFFSFFSFPVFFLFSLISFFISFLVSLPAVMAHCPLCTVTAAAAAGGAAMLGVKGAVVGLFTGAAAAAMGIWVGRKVKKKYVPFQALMLTTASVALTVIPVVPFVKEMPLPLYVSLIGSYGSLLNRTYLFNKFILGSILGAVLMYGAPAVSRLVSRVRGAEKPIPFQGIIIIAALLIFSAALLQAVL